MRQFEKKSINDLGGTLNEIASPSELSARDVIECINWRVHKDGKSREKRLGYIKHDTNYNFNGEAVRGIFGFQDDDGNYRDVIITETKIWVYDPTSSVWNQVYSQTSSLSRPVKPVVFERGRPLVVGFDDNLSIEPTTAYKLGIDAPSGAPTAATGAAGNLTGNYKYVVTFYRSGNYPCESNPSPESNVVSPNSQKVNLTDIPISSDPKVTARRIYRTTAGGAIFYWLADINDNTTTTFTDNYTDNELGDEVSYDRYPPPEGDYIETWDNRIWIAVNNKVYWTNTGTAEEMAATNFFQVKARESDNITGLKALGDALYIFKNNSIFKVEMVGDSSYKLSKLPFKIGCDTPASISASADFLFFKSKQGIEIFNGYSLFRPVISRVIKKTMDSINQDYEHLSFGEINDVENEYWLSVPTGTATEPDKVIVFDIEKAIFTIYEFDKNMTAFYNSKNSSEENIFVSGSSDGNFYIQGSGYTDDGVAISSEFSWGWKYPMEEKDIWTALRRLEVYYILPANKTITLEIYKNLKKDPIATLSLPGSTPTTGGLDEYLRRELMQVFKLGIRGYGFFFKFSNNEDCGDECRILGWDIYYHKKLWKKSLKGN